MRAIDDLVNELAARELDAMLDADKFDVTRFAAIHRALQPVAMRQFVAARIGTLRGISRAHIDALVRLAVEAGPSASLNLPHGWRAVGGDDSLVLRNSAPRVASL